jgi:hypothetical protein
MFRWLQTEILPPATPEFDRFICVVGLALALLLSVFCWRGVLSSGDGSPWAITNTLLTLVMGVHLRRAHRRVKCPAAEAVDQK